MAYADKTLACKDCGAQFTFTQGEQAFYASKGLMNEPTRCPECRSARKRAQSSSGYGDDTGYGSPRPDNSFRQMYDVTCDQCGRPARVPFQPRGDRPVYCSDCFQQQRASRPSGGYGGY